MADLKQPPDPRDVEAHQQAKAALKAFDYERLTARRWHAHAVAVIDALTKAMKDEIATAHLYDRPAIIERCRAELRPFFRPEH